MDIEKKVRRFISTNFIMHDQNIELKNNASLLEQGVIDSTGVLELVSFLKHEFAVHVGEDEITPENLDSIENIVKFVNNKRNLNE